jgi:hypothetical protein
MRGSVDAVPNRREFCRVDVYIPMEYRLVDPEERSLVKSRISGEVLLPDFTMMPPLQDQQMEYLNQFNHKLDTIIRMLALQFEGFHALPFKFISLSGSGMKFSSQSPFSHGDLLEFKMILTLYQPIAFYLYGEVIRVEKQTSGYFINIQFTAINDMIRDKIIKFVFEMEREMLREKRGD